MRPDLEAFLKVRAALDAAPVPTENRSAWMSRETFLALGGTQERWDAIPGDPEVKHIHG